MVEQKSIKSFEMLVADFRSLTTKVQKDNQNVTKNLKETNLVLEGCQKEDQKLYFEHENQKTKKNQEQQEEFLKYRNNYKGQTKNKAPAPHDKMIKLSDVKFDDKNLRNLLAVQRKPKTRRYYDVYSDDGGESGNEFRENESESSNEGIVKKKT